VKKLRLYYSIFKKPWPYWVAGIILAILNILLLVLTGSPWKVTTGFLFWGAGLLKKIGLNAEGWYYFSLYNNSLKEGQSFIENAYTVINIAVILGALIFYLITFWAIDHVVNFIKWIEESLVRAPITDIISGSVGLGFGLIVAFLIGSAITMPILNTAGYLL